MGDIRIYIVWWPDLGHPFPRSWVVIAVFHYSFRWQHLCPL